MWASMLEAVQSFADSRDFNEVRDIQRRILDAYEQDFPKHAPQRSSALHPDALEQYSRSACQGEQEIYLWANQGGGQSKRV